jgi:hypothetical protein
LSLWLIDRKKRSATLHLWVLDGWQRVWRLPIGRVSDNVGGGVAQRL